MELSAPKNVVFIIALVLALLALAGKFVIGGALALNAFWILLVGFVVLAAGCLLKGV